MAFPRQRAGEFVSCGWRLTKLESTSYLKPEATDGDSEFQHNPRRLKQNPSTRRRTTWHSFRKPLPSKYTTKSLKGDGLLLGKACRTLSAPSQQLPPCRHRRRPRDRCRGGRQQQIQGLLQTCHHERYRQHLAHSPERRRRRRKTSQMAVGGDRQS